MRSPALRPTRPADPKKLAPAELKRLRDAVGVRAQDDQTLEFKLVDRAPYFPTILATWNGLPVRQDLIEKGGAKWMKPATYIGNGPMSCRSGSTSRGSCSWQTRTMLAASQSLSASS